VHFLLLGFLIFWLFSWQREDSDRLIRVDEASLAQWLQFRNKAFTSTTASAVLMNLSSQQKSAYTKEFIREEALYRYALRLGLDKHDAVLRQRLVQKAEFVLFGIGGEEQEPGREEVKAFFQANRDKYRIPANASLKHVFLSSELVSENAQSAQQRAQAALSLLKQGRPFDGDRFPFQKNYVEVQKNMLADHLGREISERVFSGQLPAKQWSEPLPSPYGWHLVQVLALAPEHYPTFDMVSAEVAADLMRKRKTENRTVALDALVTQYNVRVEL
jgi:hypothetical protein